MPKVTRVDWSPKLKAKKGRACVAIPGRGDVYLGCAFNQSGNPKDPPSDEAKRRYRALIAEWQTTGALASRGGGRKAQESPPIRELIDLWLERVVGRQFSPSVRGEIVAALVHLDRLYADMNAAEFRPIHLITVREAMLEGFPADEGQEARAGVSRPVANRYTSKIRRLFRWATEMELVPADTYARLKTVEGVKASRQDVHDPEPVCPVADEVYGATLPHLAAKYADVLRLMRYSGARPSEILLLRWRHIDLTTDPNLWEYAPPKHKTQWKGKSRTIHFGPKAQAVLRGYATTEDRRLFPFNRDTLRQALTRACARAFPHPVISNIKRNKRTKAQREELREWNKAHCWHPNQLRHTRATEIRKAMGLEAAGAVLGHSGLDVTLVYAERDQQLARRAAAATG